MEKGRKAFHVAFGLLVLMLLRTDVELAQAFLLVSLIGGLWVLSRKLGGRRVHLAERLIAAFGREEETPGRGAFWFVLGLLAISCFLPNPEEAFSAVLMLGIADGASALAGSGCRWRLPHNRQKSVCGSAAFALVSMISFFWVGRVAVPFALLGAGIESMDNGFDDNLTLSLFAIVFFVIF